MSAPVLSAKQIAHNQRNAEAREAANQRRAARRAEGLSRHAEHQANQKPVAQMPSSSDQPESLFDIIFGNFFALSEPVERAIYPAKNHEQVERKNRNLAALAENRRQIAEAKAIRARTHTVRNLNTAATDSFFDMLGVRFAA